MINGVRKRKRRIRFPGIRCIDHWRRAGWFERGPLYIKEGVLKTILISVNIGGQVADTYDIENYLGFSQIETFDLIKKFEDAVSINKFGEIGIDYLCNTNIPGVFACGDVSNVPFKQVIIAAGEGAKAALAAYDFLNNM